MTDAYTYLPKPTGADYSNTNVQGREQYDQADLSYDDSNTFYDGVNQSAYTDIPKPIGGAVIQRGMATGLVIPLTYAKEYQLGSSYTNIPKPLI